MKWETFIKVIKVIEEKLNEYDTESEKQSVKIDSIELVGDYMDVNFGSGQLRNASYAPAKLTIEFIDTKDFRIDEY